MADPAKEAEKARKKAEKEAKKQAKKEAKAAKKAGKAVEDDEEGGGGVIVALVSVIIVVVWLAILCLLVKFDIGGFGSTVLYPLLKDVPYVNMILPDNAVASGDAEGEYGYASLSEAIEQIKALELENQSLTESSQAKDQTINDLNSEISRLKNYETEYSEFEKIRKEYYEEVVFGEESPDISEYQKYYESIDAASAAELYKQVVKQTSHSDEVKDYAATYATMKPAAAAKIFENMTNNLSLVCEILDAMGSDDRAAILAAMDSEVAASITKLMAPENK